MSSPITYESLVCGIQNKNSELNEVTALTQRLGMFYGTKKFADISTGSWKDVKDTTKKMAYKAEHDLSGIDLTADGNKTVKCVYSRDATTELSSIDFKQSNI